MPVLSAKQRRELMKAGLVRKSEEECAKVEALKKQVAKPQPQPPAKEQVEEQE